MPTIGAHGDAERLTDMRASPVARFLPHVAEHLDLFGQAWRPRVDGQPAADAAAPGAGPRDGGTIDSA
jgi:hypothetical protein